MRGFLWWAVGLSLLAPAVLGEERIAEIYEGTNIALAVSPDHTTLVVDLIGQLWRLPLDGGAANPLTATTTIARNPRFSPDGRTLVYQSEEDSQWDLWLLDVGRGVSRRLTHTPNDETAPDFSADGNAVVFSSNLAGSFDIWELTLGSGKLTQLSRESGNAHSPAVSERGEIAYVNERGGRWSLELLRDGRSIPVLSEHHPLRAPSWRPGGGVLLFNEQPPGDRSNLRMVLLDEGRLTKTLTHGEDVFGFRPAWLGPGEFVYTADGRIWRRRLAGATRQPIQLFAGVAVTRPVYPRRSVDLGAAPGAGAGSQPYVIQVGRLFDGIRNQYRRHMDVHVEGGRISAVVARGTRPLPTRVVDARGLTLIPGLIDLHAHPPRLDTDRAGRAWLAYGVTTVRELDAPPTQGADGPGRRAAWSAAPHAGPRLLLTAPAAQAPEKSVDGEEPPFHVFELRRELPGRLVPEVLGGARAMGVPVFGQALFPGSRFGIDALEHIGARAHQPFSLERSALDRSYQDVVGILGETGTVVTPTLVAFGGFSRLAARDPATWSRDAAYRRLFSPAERAHWERQAETGPASRLDRLASFASRLARSGARVAAGSDAPSVPYGLGLHAELALLSEGGIPNDQVLRMATAQAALALGMERDLGTVEAGKLADFVLLSGNPLTRIQESLRIEAVVKDGVWMDRETILPPP